MRPPSVRPLLHSRMLAAGHMRLVAILQSACEGRPASPNPFPAPDKSYYLCVPPMSIKVWWIGSFYLLRVDTEVRLIFNHIKMCMHCAIHKHNECRLLRSSHAGCPTINSAQMQSVWLWNKCCDRHTVLTARWESSVTSNHTDYRLPLTDCTDTLMSHGSAQQPN